MPKAKELVVTRELPALGRLEPSDARRCEQRHEAKRLAASLGRTTLGFADATFKTANGVVVAGGGAAAELVMEAVAVQGAMVAQDAR